MGADAIKDYKALKKLAESGDPALRRRRGQDFEHVLKKLFESESLQPRIRIRPQGEEIDGSFVLGDRTFLLEAKWHSDPLPASQIYAFKGKVDGKLAGTIGVFISMSGYSSDAVDALCLGKALNVVLFDCDDFEEALINGFRKVLLAKLRYAAEEGGVYFPYRSTQIYGGPDPDQQFLAPEHELPTERAAFGSPEDIVIICEGSSDKIVLTELAARILRTRRLARRIVVIPAMGKLGIPLLANGLREISSGPKFILVADSDGDPKGTERQLREGLEEDVHRIVVVHPAIEAWLFPGEPDPRDYALTRSRQESHPVGEVTRAAAKAINLEELQARNQAFVQFVEAITS